MLKKLARECLALTFRFSGLPFVIRQTLCKNKATIIVFHNPRLEFFERHVKWLNRHYNLIPLGKLVRAIETKTWSDIPRRSLVVTIDDGHKGSYALLEIFKRYQINPTVYLCSHLVGTFRHFWWKTGYEDNEKLKTLPHDLMLEILRDKVGFELEREYEERHSLNVEEIVEMFPYVEFGSHTKFHPILTRCTSDKSVDEIQKSKEYLEMLLHQPIEHFAFPSGEYSNREVEYVKKAGYRSSRTLDCGWVDVDSDFYRLNVNEVQDNATINILCAQVSGFFPRLRFLRKNLMAMLNRV